MTYLDTMNPLYPAWSWIAWVIGGILLVGGLTFIMNELSSTGRAKVMLPACAAFLLGGYLACVPYVTMVGAQQSMANLKANINAKYDVREIVEDYPKHRLIPSATSQEIVVITPKNETVIFVLKQNPKTFEPTLLDSAIQSGTAPSGAVTVKDVTR